jgi:hypothetical protein
MPYFLNNYNLLIIIITLLFTLVGCKKQNKNPELLDPIYLHLLKKKKELTKQAKENRVSIEQNEKVVSNSLPRSAERIVAKKALRKAIKNQMFLDQKAKFYTIRAEHRKYQCRKSYKIAFMKNKPWPNPKEYENFITNNRLKEAPLNWGQRVPKLFKNNPNFIAK